MSPEANLTLHDEPTLRLAEQLIACRSVTPDDAGCLPIIVERLSALGFACEFINRGGVSNLWARRGQARPLHQRRAENLHARRGYPRRAVIQQHAQHAPRIVGRACHIDGRPLRAGRAGRAEAQCQQPL